MKNPEKKLLKKVPKGGGSHATLSERKVLVGEIIIIYQEIIKKNNKNIGLPKSVRWLRLRSDQ